jgi:hypothetical protein
VPQARRGHPLDFLEYIGRGILGPDPDEEVDVIGLDGQFLDVPTLLRTLGLDELAAVLGHLAHQDRLSPLGTPDEVVDDEMNPVLITLIFHVDSLQDFDIFFNSVVWNRQAKAQDGETRLTTGAEAPWLAAG